MLAAKAVKALGAMSGTSLDGVDAAVVVTDGVGMGQPPDAIDTFHQIA